MPAPRVNATMTRWSRWAGPCWPAENWGSSGGLPATIVVRADLTDLDNGIGHGVTAGGTLLPMSDVLRLASHAYHYLVIFDGKGIALHLGRARRTASPGQRIVLLSQHGGCTMPGCTASGYRS
ncbi:MAG: DUF222 domain-containing protein, partial [Mycobacterium sp.]